MTTPDISVSNKHLLQLYRFRSGHFLSLVCSDHWLRGFFWALSPTSRSGTWKADAETAEERVGKEKNTAEEQLLTHPQTAVCKNGINTMYKCQKNTVHTKVKQKGAVKYVGSGKWMICQLFKSNPVMWTIRSEEKSIHFSWCRNGKQAGFCKSKIHANKKK